MKTQQQADREEQQRIKNLVLNYDLSNDNDQNDGEDPLDLSLQRNLNAKKLPKKGFEKRGAPKDAKFDKSSSTRSGFRSRRLQLSDVDWYD
jgi:regulator of nonsense transcripts 2